MNVRSVIVALFVAALLVVGSAGSVLAQAGDEKPPVYASWFDVLDSFSGNVTLAARSPTQSDLDANLTFAMVNNGDLASSDYFVEMNLKEANSSDTHNALIFKDNIAARWERYTGDWTVEDRAENSNSQDFVAILAQADTVVKTLFGQKVLLTMATNQGVEEVNGRNAVHYTLDVPDAVFQFLLKQVAGESAAAEVTVDKAQFDFWLDETYGVLTQLRGALELHETEGNQEASIDLELAIENIDNVSLALPEDVRKEAMSKGLLTPDFASDVIVIGAGDQP